jgi:6-phosphogluconolactonase/glucosamine-6-phosphate isomerase/deaminase
VRQIDERVAPDGDPGRNATSLRAELLDRVPIPERNILLMDVTATDLAGAARAYADKLRPLDLAHLGMGADGHTASWPPDQADVRTTYERVTVTDLFNGYRRMTLTQNGIAEVGHVVWLICGADKREPLKRALDGDPTLPATHAFALRPKGPSHIPVFVDSAAAPGAHDLS